MPTFRDEDLAYIQAAGFGAMAGGVAAQIVAILFERRLRNGTIGDVGSAPAAARGAHMRAGVMRLMEALKC